MDELRGHQFRRPCLVRLAQIRKVGQQVFWGPTLSRITFPFVMIEKKTSMTSSVSVRPLPGYDAGCDGSYERISGNRVFATRVACSGVYPPVCSSECANTATKRASLCETDNFVGGSVKNDFMRRFGGVEDQVHLFRRPSRRDDLSCSRVIPKNNCAFVSTAFTVGQRDNRETIKSGCDCR